MKTPVIVLLAALLLGCEPQSKTSDPITNRNIEAVLAKWGEAMKTKDTTMLGEVLHRDYYYAGHADGSLTSRRQMLEGLLEDPSTVLSQNLYDLSIRPYDNMAIVRGWEILKIRTEEGDTLEFRLRFTDVYRKENGITKALSTHSSPIQ